jgi:spore coat polysaccharide biosynthesis predicted glycosyltransferase SpsG
MTGKTVLFRCDSSREIGLGHVVRCEALACKLERENRVVFATTPDETNRIVSRHEQVLKKEGETEERFLERTSTSVSPDVVVIDKKHRYSSESIIKAKRANEKTVMLDNICEGLAQCDEIVFPNAHFDVGSLRGSLPPDKLKSIRTGPEYVILRDEVLSAKRLAKHTLSDTPRIVLTTGGSDPEGILLKLIGWLKDADIRARFVALKGDSFKLEDELVELAKSLPPNFEVLPYSPEKAVGGEIAVSTFGMSIYEMIYWGTPTICVSHSPENASAAKRLATKFNVIDDLGLIDDIGPNDLIKSIEILSNESVHRGYVERCENFIDGKGAERVSKLIVS